MTFEFSRLFSVKQKIAILYLGKRGGGAQLTSLIANELGKSLFYNLTKVGLRKDYELISSIEKQKQVLILPKGYTPKTIFVLIKYYFSPNLLLRKMQISKGDYCLVPMVSPAGFLIEKILRKAEINVITIIHDAKKHDGDIWPTNRKIRRIITHSNFLITMSENVDKIVRDLNPNLKTHLVHHPSFKYKFDAAQTLELPEKYILFIGRIKKYKGLETLISAFELINLKDVKLVIAGEGRLAKISDPRIIIYNKWLTENEIVQLISKSQLVVFPYSEVSQSGFLPYCIETNKKIVLSALQGFELQVGTYPNVVFSENTPNELAKNILTAQGMQAIEPVSRRFNFLEELEKALSSIANQSL